MHAAGRPRGSALFRRGVGLLTVLVCAGVAVRSAGAPEPSISLAYLLRGMNRASSLYLDGALKFTCLESITERRALPPFQEGINDWIGTAWIDPETFQILQVEAGKAELLTKQRQIENREFGAPPPGSSYLSMHVVTEFSVEKNGMRFPGKVEMVSTKYRIPYAGFQGKRVKIYEERTVQTYSRYRFFGVRTRDEIQGFLAGAKQEDPPSP